MLDARLLTSGVFGLVAAAAWAAVGVILLRRREHDAGSKARRRFAVWWLALAAYTSLNDLLGIAVAVDRAPGRVALHALLLAFAFLIAVMFWGLMSYMAYLVTGRAGALIVTTWAYAAQLAALVVIVFVLDPVGARPAGWSVGLEYAHGDFAAANLVFALAFLLPPLAASIAYLALWIRVKDPASRFRIALVGGSILAWLLIALIAARSPPDADALQITLKLLSIVAALAPVVAYAPPRVLARRVPARAVGEVTRPPLTLEDRAR